jgi:hypothetical protein
MSQEKQTVSSSRITKKKAFLICPIGEEASEVRQRSDKILKHIIIPVCDRVRYKIERADMLDQPGLITNQIVKKIIDADLIIADLTGQNPNVFYELALCHILRKPTVQMIKKGEKLPFDIATTRTIQVDHTDLDNVNEAKKVLARQIIAVEKNPNDVDSPLDWVNQDKPSKDGVDPQKAAIDELIKLTLQVITSIEAIKNAMNKDNINRPITGFLESDKHYFADYIPSFEDKRTRRLAKSFTEFAEKLEKSKEDESKNQNSTSS